MTLRRGLVVLALFFFILAAASLVLVDLVLVVWLNHMPVDQAKLLRVQKILDIATLKFASAAVGPVLLLIGYWVLRRGDKPWARFVVGMGGLITITEYVIDLIKWLFGRLRPHQWLDTVPDPSLWFAGGTSFPSGHAGYYAALAGGLAIRFPRHAAFLLPIPVFVAMQRVMVDKHYLSDVLTSIGIAMTAAAIMANYLRPPALSREM